MKKGRCSLALSFSWPHKSGSGSRGEQEPAAARGAAFMRGPLQTGPGTSRSGRGHGLGASAAQHSHQPGQSEPKEPVTEGPRRPAPCRPGPEPAPLPFVEPASTSTFVGGGGATAICVPLLVRASSSVAGEAAPPCRAEESHRQARQVPFCWKHKTGASRLRRHKMAAPSPAPADARCLVPS